MDQRLWTIKKCPGRELGLTHVPSGWCMPNQCLTESLSQVYGNVGCDGHNVLPCLICILPTKKDVYPKILVMKITLHRRKQNLRKSKRVPTALFWPRSIAKMEFPEQKKCVSSQLWRFSDWVKISFELIGYVMRPPGEIIHYDWRGSRYGPKCLLGVFDVV